MQPYPVSDRTTLWRRIVTVAPDTYAQLALDVYRYQYHHNPAYRQWCDLLNRTPGAVRSYADIPHLPISCFKSHDLRSGVWQPEVEYTSSGTTGATTARHPVRSVSAYLAHAQCLFEAVYGQLECYTVLALLPAYLERSGSSLVAMAEHFIKASGRAASGFYLYDYPELVTRARRELAAGRKVLILGVSFALWEMAEQHPTDLSGAIIMETGGMKGRRREIIRAELHGILTDAFGVPTIHSEYGMTELLSQAYSLGHGIFEPSATLRVRVREVNDPFHYLPEGRTGGINVTDLANLDTISFIATDDLGTLLPKGRFEVLGRFDNSDVRGCNLLVQ